MMDVLDPDRPDAPLYGLYKGTVIDRDDPLLLNRIRVHVPGLFEDGTGWAVPMMLGGGGPQRGMVAVPPKGATVCVFFEAGNPDAPNYLGGNLGSGEQLTGTDGDPDVQAWETQNYVVAIDDRSTTQSLTIKDKVSGDMIQLNGKDRTMTITALAAIAIKAQGMITIDAPQVVVNGIPAGMKQL